MNRRRKEQRRQGKARKWGKREERKWENKFDSESRTYEKLYSRQVPQNRRNRKTYWLSIAPITLTVVEHIARGRLGVGITGSCG